MRVKVQVTQLCLTHYDPWTEARQASLSMELSRQEYWSGLPWQSQTGLGSSQPRAWTQVSHHCRQILYYLSHQGSPCSYLIVVGLKPKVIGICIRRRKFGTTKAHRECHMKTEAETGVIYKPEKTKNCQQPQESRRETWNRSVPCNFRGNKVLLTTRFYPSGLQNQETIHFSCFKPLDFG